MRNAPLTMVSLCLLAAACSSNTTSSSASDAGCPVPCGATCCESNLICEAGQCRVPAVSGNGGCTTAHLLDFTSAGVATLRGDTSQSAGTQAGSCGGDKNDEVVFSFEVAQRSKVSVSAHADYGSELHPAVYLRTDCGKAETELGCASSGQTATSASLTIPVIAPGTYWLYVDGDDKYLGSGAFELKVVLSDPDQPAPENDVCANATPIVLDVNGAGSAMGSTAYATNDAVGRCDSGTSMTGGDVVHFFTLANKANVTVHVTGGANYKPAAFVRDGCGPSARELACGAAAVSSVNIAMSNLEAGTYYLYVDGLNGGGGDYRVDISTGVAPANDTCAAPAAVELVAGAGHAHGDTTFARPDTSGGSPRTCGGDNGQDLVYAFTLEQDKAVKITVTPSSNSSFSPVAYLRTECAVAASLKACAQSGSGKAVTLELSKLSAGTYYLWVDGFSSGTSGPFDVKIETQEPQVVPKDTCAAPEPINLFGPGQVTVSGTTADGADDYRGSCGGNGGADLVYSLRLNQPASVTATLARDGQGQYSPVVYLRGDCSSAAAADEIDCGAAGSRSSSATAESTYLPAGTYYIVADGGTTAGAFKLTVAVGAPIPNDTCALPTAIDIDEATGAGQASGDTTRATNDTSGSCFNNAGTYGNDLVYSFTLQQERTVHISVAPTGSFKPAVFLRKTCSDKTAQIACNAVSLATPTVIDEPVLSAGTYYLWVDGNGDRQKASNGAFTITLTTSDPPAAPTGDECSSALPLVFQATSDSNVRAATVHGDTRTARDSGEGLGFCAGCFGGDVVYKFSLTAARKVTAKVTPAAAASGFQPYVYIRSNCASAAAADMVACGAYDAMNDFAFTTANSLNTGTYYVWVDGKGTGAFDLEVSTMPPGTGPANDNCSAPQSLTFTNDTATVTATTTGAENDAMAQSGQGSGGPDVVYAFATAKAQKITMTVTPAPNMQLRPVVYLRTACADSSTQVAYGIAPRAADPVTATAANLPAGTYYLWVDSAGQAPAATGAYTLAVTLAAP